MSECQTIGGYPRIGTVLPADLPRLAQAPVGAELRFTFVGADGQKSETMTDMVKQLRNKVQPLLRDPRDMRNLLGYEFISGMTRGDDIERG